MHFSQDVFGQVPNGLVRHAAMFGVGNVAADAAAFEESRGAALNVSVLPILVAGVAGWGVHEFFPSRPSWLMSMLVGSVLSMAVMGSAYVGATLDVDAENALPPQASVNGWR